jgi:1,4-alpha-glucan branching enzyme
MYSSMSKLQSSLVVDRGVALHKMIRLITIALGGEGYLNFIGNEFGHPEWVDFPREGNNWSYQYARRQWSLVDTDHLRYHDLNDWDRDMLNVMKENRVLMSSHAEQLFLDAEKKILIFKRGGLIFIFSFNVDQSYFGYEFKVPEKGKYRIVLNSDNKKYGGFERISENFDYPTDKKNMLKLYLPNRTALVLKKI